MQMEPYLVKTWLPMSPRTQHSIPFGGGGQQRGLGLPQGLPAASAAVMAHEPACTAPREVLRPRATAAWSLRCVSAVFPLLQSVTQLVQATVVEVEDLVLTLVAAHPGTRTRRSSW